MIRSRQLLPCPEDCPSRMYAFMVECWHEVINYYSDEEDGDHGEDESDAGDDDHYWSKFKIFNVSGSNSSTCLPRDSPKTAPVGGFGGKVIR